MKFAVVLILILTLGMILAGFLIGLGLGDKLAPPPTLITPAWVSSRSSTPSPLPTTLSPHPTQTAFLFLMVDTLGQDPTLEMCWVITFQPDVPQYYLVGVPVEARVALPGAAAQSIRSIYNVDVGLQRGNVFTRDALRILYPDLVTPQVEVTFDRATLMQAIDLLGGVLLNGEIRSGADVLAYYDTIPADSEIAQLDFQSTLLVNLFQTAKERHWTMENLFAFLHLGQTWSPDYDTFLQWMHIAPPLTEADFIPLPGHVELAPQP